MMTPPRVMASCALARAFCDTASYSCTSTTTDALSMPTNNDRQSSRCRCDQQEPIELWLTSYSTS
jgi:hypothetical protein